MTNFEKKSTTETPLKHSWGARFRAAREAMHLSERDAAGRLHLKSHIITIIESENFEKGPPAIFMRGYIRSYGRLLNISDKEMAQALSQLDLANPATTAIPPASVQHLQKNNNFAGLSTVAVILMLSALVGVWWWNTHVRNVATETMTAANYTEDGTTAAATPAAEPAPIPVATDVRTTTPPGPIDTGAVGNPPPSASATPPITNNTAAPANQTAQTTPVAPATTATAPAAAPPSTTAANNVATPADTTTSSTTNTNTPAAAPNTAPVTAAAKHKSAGLGDAPMLEPEEENLDIDPADGNNDN